MEEISYENIDSFYYHAIDIDFFRFTSILENGILSKKAAEDLNIKSFYRNYTHASCKEQYISVSHFPLTVFRYYKIQNELYDFNTNKISFILSGEIDTLEKQFHKNRYHYTNERHVEYRIETKDILGIVIRETDANKLISEIAFNSKYTDKEFLEHKMFSVMNFFTDYFGSFGNRDLFYNLIGRLREKQVTRGSDEEIVKKIEEEMRKRIHLVLSTVLEKEEPTLLDAIQYFNQNQYPIYLMNRYDIKEVGKELRRSDPRMEKFESLSPSIKSQIRKEYEIDKKIWKLLSNMSEEGLNIYFEYTLGALTESDYKIVQKVKKLKMGIDQEEKK